MSIDLSGTTITNDGSGLATAYGGATLLKQGGYGLVKGVTGHPMFFTTGNTAGWSYPANGDWAPIPLNVPLYNYQSCYNASNYRFTAPVSGLYLFTGQTYGIIGTLGHYYHPMFWVNGSSSTRRPIGGGVYRMRGHGITAGYSCDGDITETINLVAGDYVQYYHFFSNNTVGVYTTYSNLAGTLVG